MEPIRNTNAAIFSRPSSPNLTYLNSEEGVDFPNLDGLNNFPTEPELDQYVPLIPNLMGGQRVGRNVDRPITDRLTIKYLICIDKSPPIDEPKEGTTFWSYLKSKNLIKENIVISRTEPDQTYARIYNLFREELNNRRWILYRVSAGKLTKVYDNISFELTKSHVTITGKLYVGPDTYDKYDINPNNRFDTLFTNLEDIYPSLSVNPSANYNNDPNNNPTSSSRIFNHSLSPTNNDTYDSYDINSNNRSGTSVNLSRIFDRSLSLTNNDTYDTYDINSNNRSDALSVWTRERERKLSNPTSSVRFFDHSLSLTNNDTYDTFANNRLDTVFTNLEGMKTSYPSSSVNPSANYEIFDNNDTYRYDYDTYDASSDTLSIWNNPVIRERERERELSYPSSSVSLNANYPSLSDTYDINPNNRSDTLSIRNNPAKREKEIIRRKRSVNLININPNIRSDTLSIRNNPANRERERERELSYPSSFVSLNANYHRSDTSSIRNNPANRERERERELSYPSSSVSLNANYHRSDTSSIRNNPANRERERERGLSYSSSSIRLNANYPSSSVYDIDPMRPSLLDPVNLDTNYDHCEVMSNLVSIFESSSEQIIRLFRLNHGITLTGAYTRPSTHAITVEGGELRMNLYEGQPLVYTYINSNNHNIDKQNTCINFPIAEIIYNGDFVESFSKCRDNGGNLNELYGHFLARKFLAGGQLFIKDSTFAQINILKFYLFYIYNSAKRFTKIQFNNLFDLKLLPKMKTFDGKELNTYAKLIRWMNGLYQKKKATIISYDDLTSVTQLKHRILSTDIIESPNEKVPGVANYKERLTLDEWVGDEVHDNLMSWIEDFHLFQGLIIDRDHEIKISKKFVINFIEIPKVNPGEKVYLKMIKPSTNLETILISNNIFSIKNLSAFPFIDNSNVKSYRDYVFILLKYERYEIILNKNHIKVTIGFKQMIENALSSVKPLKALRNIFNEYGHLFPQRIILGRSLKNILPENSISFDNPDTINFNLKSPPAPTTSYIDMIDFNSELKISDYFQNISNISYLLTQEGEVVEKNDIHNWIKNPNNNLKIIEYDNIIPLYKILEEEQQRKIDDILKKDLRIIMTGISNLKDLDNNNAVHYKRINLNPESVLEDEDYEVFGSIIVTENNTKLEEIYVNFGLYDFSGFYAIIKKSEKTSIDITKCHVLWMIVGNPSKLLVLSPNNREFQVDYVKTSITLQPDKLNYNVKAPFQLFQGYIISIHAYYSSTNCEPTNIIKLVEWNDEFITIQLTDNTVTFNNNTRLDDEDNNSSANIDIDLHICILSGGYKNLKIDYDYQKRECSLDLIGFVLTKENENLEKISIQNEIEPATILMKANNNNSPHMSHAFIDSDTYDFEIV